MSQIILLAILAGLGVGLVALPDIAPKFAMELPKEAADRLWFQTVRLFAIPATLAALSLKKTRVFCLANAAYGLWLTYVSLIALSPFTRGESTNRGYVEEFGPGLTLILALSLTVFSIKRYWTSGKPSKKSTSVAPQPTTVSRPETPPGVMEDE